ncbi:hypothetical protein [Risungbinella massiliensis]|uniref:hypothetical protein n=1 Tax=Risungbinella massiliensis TaxID=1329796 RepID=UPI0005CC5010|nr:hypothetical protein [Risungbinella massiliensis]
MAASKNLVKNSDFRQGLAPWKGSQIRVVSNPLIKGDSALLMKALSGDAIVSQRQPFLPQTNMAYYLYFRVFNATPRQGDASLQAVVAYQDANGNNLRITPLLLEIPSTNTPKYLNYYTIVPPPPKTTRKILVVFVLKSGLILLDTIRLLARPVGS